MLVSLAQLSVLKRKEKFQCISLNGAFNVLSFYFEKENKVGGGGRKTLLTYLMKSLTFSFNCEGSWP